MTKLESIINEQDSEMKIMKQQIRKLRTKPNTKEAILEQVLQENKKCVSDLQSANQAIKHTERAVDILLNAVHTGSSLRKAMIQISRKVMFSQNKKIGSSFTKRTNVF